MARKTYRYHFKMGRKTLYSGITKDLEKRERELKLKFGEDGYIKQVGSRVLVRGQDTYCPRWL